MYALRITTVENFMKSASGQVTGENIKNYISDKKGLERQEFARLYRSVLLWNEVMSILLFSLNLLTELSKSNCTFSERGCQKYLLSQLQRH